MNWEKAWWGIIDYGPISGQQCYRRDQNQGGDNGDHHGNLFDSSMGHHYVSRSRNNAVILIAMSLEGYQNVSDTFR